LQSPQGVRLPNMVKLHIFCNPSFFNFLSRASTGARRYIFQAYVSNDVVCHKEVPFGVSSMKIFFLGVVPLPPNFHRAFYMQIEKVK
jgi:hypothetical protein